MKLTEEMFRMVARRFTALADENRLRLLARLREGPANVTTLAAVAGIAQPSVTKHLAVLREVGLVDAERVGTQSIYRIADEQVFRLCELVCDGVIRHAEQRRAALTGLIASNHTAPSDPD